VGVDVYFFLAALADGIDAGCSGVCCEGGGELVFDGRFERVDADPAGIGLLAVIGGSLVTVFDMCF
jgi:hypothetical protein